MVINPVTNNSDVFSENMRHGIIHLVGEITEEMAASIMAQCFAVREEDKNRTIKLYINSPGGSVSAGLAIYDTVRQLIAEGVCVKTICVGVAASMAAVILSGGTERAILPLAEVMIHQPSGGASGRTSDILVAAEHIKSRRQVLTQILAKNTGQTMEKVSADIELDHWMDAQGALEYGIVDYMVDSKG